MLFFKKNKIKNLKVLIFSKGNFKESATRLTSHLKQIGIQNVINKTDEDLDENFKLKHEKILSNVKGYGYCIWKPYLILQELNKLEKNENLLYIDSTDRPTLKFIISALNKLKKEDLFLINRGYFHDNWTRRDTFVLMGCDSQEFHNKIQLEAGIIGFNKTNFTIRFVEEWYLYCSNEQILGELPLSCGLENFEPFLEHRYDQSVLTNLQIKHRLNHYFVDEKEVRFNYFQPKKYIDTK